MADLKNSTITNLTVTNNVTCNSTVIASSMAYLDAQPDINNSYTTTGVIDFTNDIHLQQNFDKVGGRFTALEEGMYMMMFSNISNASDVTSRTFINVNGVRLAQARGQGLADYPMVNAVHTYYLNVGDYVELEHTEGQIYLTQGFTGFIIHRIF